MNLVLARPCSMVPILPLHHTDLEKEPTNNKITDLELDLVKTHETDSGLVLFQETFAGETRSCWGMVR